MIETVEYREICIRISTGEVTHIAQEIRRTTLEQWNLAHQRYGSPAVAPTIDESDTPAVRFARAVLELAKQMLPIDGSLVPIAFLLLPDRGLAPIVLNFADSTEKFLVWARVASDVARLGATAVVVVAESWFAPFDPVHPDRRAADAPERREAITVNAISQDGEDLAITQLFSRSEGKIIFEDAFDDTSGRSAFLDPIKRVWNKSAPER
jgi:hypothetical protein